MEFLPDGGHFAAVAVTAFALPMRTRIPGTERSVGASDGDGSKAQKCRSPSAGPAYS